MICAAIREADADCDIKAADDLMVGLRSVKSEHELVLLRKAYKLSEQGVEAALEAVKPGVTELQVVAEAQRTMIAGGAEGTAYSIWCATGPNTRHPIARSTNREIRRGELGILGIGCRVGGYCSSVGRVFVIGALPPGLARLSQDSCETETFCIGLMGAEKPAREIAVEVSHYVQEKGYAPLYGPAHSVGMMECELPWIQMSSDYLIKPNMVFNVDIWLSTSEGGVRFEDGVVITESGNEQLSSARREVIHL